MTGNVLGMVYMPWLQYGHNPSHRNIDDRKVSLFKQMINKAYQTLPNYPRLTIAAAIFLRLQFLTEAS